MAKQAQGEALAQEAELLRKLGGQLAELEEMGLAALREKHRELFREEARSKNLPFLRKKLAFRLQERVHGGLSPQAQERLEALMPEGLPVKASHATPGAAASVPGNQDVQRRDPRLPAPGSVLRREHQGFAHEVEVGEDGFLYRGRAYRSLSAIAKAITGTAWNGYGFFGLLNPTGPHGRRAAAPRLRMGGEASLVAGPGEGPDERERQETRHGQD